MLTRCQWSRDSKEVVSSTGVTGVVVKKSKVVVVGQWYTRSSSHGMIDQLFRFSFIGITLG